MLQLRPGWQPTQACVNGVVTESRSYNAADQVVGWMYDVAGNLRRVVCFDEQFNQGYMRCRLEMRLT